MGKKIVIKLIRFYQLVLSPYKGRSYCNYVPSCSQYAVEAIDKGGFDPVPIGKYKRKRLH